MADSGLPSPLLSPLCKGNLEANAELLRLSAEREIALQYSKWLRSTAISHTVGILKRQEGASVYIYKGVSV